MSLLGVVSVVFYLIKHRNVEHVLKVSRLSMIKRASSCGTFPDEPHADSYRIVFTVLAVAVSGFHAALAIAGMQVNFVTVDEVGHIPAGVAIWRNGSVHAYCVNPPLGRMVAALPVLLAHPEAGSAMREPLPRIEG